MTGSGQLRPLPAQAKQQLGAAEGVSSSQGIEQGHFIESGADPTFVLRTAK